MCLCEAGRLSGKTSKKNAKVSVLPEGNRGTESVEQDVDGKVKNQYWLGAPSGERKFNLRPAKLREVAICSAGGHPWEG